MEFVSGIKSIPKSMSRLGGILERSLGKTYGNSPTSGTDSMGGISESKSWTLTIWYRQPLEIIFHAFSQEMIRPLRIESPFSILQRLHWKVKLSYNQ